MNQILTLYFLEKYIMIFFFFYVQVMNGRLLSTTSRVVSCSITFLCIVFFFFYTLIKLIFSVFVFVFLTKELV